MANSDYDYLASDKCDICYQRGSFVHSDEGILTCVGCGAVYDDTNIVSEVTFTETTGGSSAVVGQFVSSVHGAQRPFRGKGMPGLAKDAREATIEKGRQAIKKVAGQLKITNRIVIDPAQRLFHLATQYNFIQGRKTDNVAAACLYIACRRENSTHMLIDFADALRTNVYALGQTFLKFCKVLRIRLPIIDPTLYIARFAKDLGLGDKEAAVTNTALRIVQRMKRDWMDSGRRPAGICGAGLFISAKLHGINCDQKDIIERVRVCDATLKKRVVEFTETEASSLTKAEFDAGEANLLPDERPPIMKEEVKRAERRAARKKKKEMRKGGEEQQEEEEDEEEEADDAENEELNELEGPPITRQDVEAAAELLDSTYRSTRLQEKHEEREREKERELEQVAQKKEKVREERVAAAPPEVLIVEEEMEEISGDTDAQALQHFSVQELKGLFASQKFEVPAGDCTKEDLIEVLQKKLEEQHKKKMIENAARVKRKAAEDERKMKEEAERKMAEEEAKRKEHWQNIRKEVQDNRNSIADIHQEDVPGQAAGTSISKESRVLHQKEMALSLRQAQEQVLEKAKQKELAKQQEAALIASVKVENFSDIDDTEIDSLLCTPTEVLLKEKIWMEVNHDWLKEKEKKAAEGRQRKKTGRGRKEVTAEVAAQEMINTQHRRNKRIRKKPGRPKKTAALGNASAVDNVREEAQGDPGEKEPQTGRELHLRVKQMRDKQEKDKQSSKENTDASNKRKRKEQSVKEKSKKSKNADAEGPETFQPGEVVPPAKLIQQKEQSQTSAAKKKKKSGK